jgi:hypothetical protein
VKEQERMIRLYDGEGMGDYVYIFRTNAPVPVLKELENCSKGKEEPPIWRNILIPMGYQFELVEECRHITPYTSSNRWLEKKFPKVTEAYNAY